MVYPYKIHEKAYEEYLGSYAWYEMKRDGLGDKFMIAVEHTLELISINPEYYSRISGNFRQVKISGFPFVITYELFKRRKFIYISAITHSRRHPKEKFRSEGR